MGVVGFEPTTLGLEDPCSVQLSYTSVELEKRFLIKFGWHGRIRTYTLGINSALYCRYTTCQQRGIHPHSFTLAYPEGIEPPTRWLTATCSTAELRVNLGRPCWDRTSDMQGQSLPFYR